VPPQAARPRKRLPGPELRALRHEDSGCGYTRALFRGLFPVRRVVRRQCLSIEITTDGCSIYDPPNRQFTTPKREMKSPGASHACRLPWEHTGPAVQTHSWERPACGHRHACASPPVSRRPLPRAHYTGLETSEYLLRALWMGSTVTSRIPLIGAPSTWVNLFLRRFLQSSRPARTRETGDPRIPPVLLAAAVALLFQRSNQSSTLGVQLR